MQRVFSVAVGRGATANHKSARTLWLALWASVPPEALARLRRQRYYLSPQGMNVSTLGEPRFVSPILRTVDDRARTPANIFEVRGPPTPEGLLLDWAGPRAKLFFDPKATRAGIVTCGGLCPGLNNVIRSLFKELHHTSAGAKVRGFVAG